MTQQTGLPHNDSLIVALIDLHGLTNLAMLTPNSTAYQGSHASPRSEVVPIPEGRDASR